MRASSARQAIKRPERTIHKSDPPDQLNRASVSISANIAEGNGRFTKPDRKNFFGIARGPLVPMLPRGNACPEAPLRQSRSPIPVHSSPVNITDAGNISHVADAASVGICCGTPLVPSFPCSRVGTPVPKLRFDKPVPNSCQDSSTRRGQWGHLAYVAHTLKKIGDFQLPAG
jgi:hypothetical protein